MQVFCIFFLEPPAASGRSLFRTGRDATSSAARLVRLRIDDGMALGLRIV